MIKYILLGLLIINSLIPSSFATPSYKEKDLLDQIKIQSLISEYIIEIFNIDIENRKLYKGYSIKNINKCELELQLINYQEREKFFRINICELNIN